MKILKFYADWCGPCRTLAKRMETVSFPFESIDADDEKNEVLIEQYGIHSLPTIIVLNDDGTKRAKFVGADCTAHLKEIEELYKEEMK